MPCNFILCNTANHLRENCEPFTAYSTFASALGKQGPRTREKEKVSNIAGTTHEVIDENQKQTAAPAWLPAAQAAITVHRQDKPIIFPSTTGTIGGFRP